jgi:hypothetical protein
MNAASRGIYTLYYIRKCTGVPEGQGNTTAQYTSLQGGLGLDLVLLGKIFKKIPGTFLAVT